MEISEQSNDVNNAIAESKHFAVYTWYENGVIQGNNSDIWVG